MVRQYDADAVPAVYRLEDVPAREGDGTTQRFLRGLDAMLGTTRVEPGRVSDRHAHPWEQLVYVLDGACTFHVGGVAVDVAAGDAFWVPPGVEHGADGGDAPCTLLFAGPLREDALEHVAHQAEFPTDRPAGGGG